jgi:NhaP-type Na+/H+ or K+/H+ antiporter
MYKELAILAIFTFIYSLISGRIKNLPISGPIIFVLVGLLFGPLGLGWFKGDFGRNEYRVLVDLTLTLVLFIDAANADLSVLRRQIKIPTRMLLLGLPVTILLGFFFAWVLFDGLTLYEMAILATILAATDAALGKAVVTNEVIPPRIREGLNCESGLNDGLCVPILLVFIALAHGHAGGESEISALTLVAKEIGIGAIVGLAVAGGGAWLLQASARSGWLSAVWVQISVPALALACFAIGQSLHGSGYIAAFIGGMLFGRLAKQAKHQLIMPGEGISESMAMLTWLIFGCAVIGQKAQYFTLEIILYSILSLTLIRMVPMFLVLTGTGENPSTKLFLGWFGPRGLASIVFAIIVLNENLPGAHFMAIVVTCTIGLSLFAHGVSANPLAQWIGRTEHGLPPLR